MSYVRGTKVAVIGEFKDPETKALEDPDDVQVTIWPPEASGLPTIVRVYSAVDTSIGKVGTGIYQTVIDTAPAAGDWEYIFEGTGAEAVAVKRRLRVRERPPIVP
jgi:hypothetical protein